MSLCYHPAFFVYFVVPGKKFWSLCSQSAIFCIGWLQLSSWSKTNSARYKRCGTRAACSTTRQLFHKICFPPFAADTSLTISKHKLSIQHVSGTSLRPQLWPSSWPVARSCCSCKGLQFRWFVGAWITCKYNRRIQYTVHWILWNFFTNPLCSNTVWLYLL